MHEIGIATSILEASHQELGRHPGGMLVSVGVRVGVLSGVDIEALRFAFECIVAGTEDEHVVFVTESCPRRNRCEGCGREFQSPAASPFLDAPCPHCGNTQTSFVSGDQLDLAFVEIEEKAS
ncbi:MAG TPA: hydrogenase maturation nickel metallochaperone HypA [Acidobacteriaceae bacterium]|nr:hydrogenase maturation nickel metallochaperone HypA [Acidobacteriaceae bacterium]